MTGDAVTHKITINNDFEPQSNYKHLCIEVLYDSPISSWSACLKLDANHDALECHDCYGDLRAIKVSHRLTLSPYIFSMKVSFFWENNVCKFNVHLLTYF